MLQWAQQKYRERPWLSVVVAAFVALSAIELVRVFLYEGPRSFAIGVHPWERAPAPDGIGTQPFRWTGGEAQLYGPVMGPVLEIPFYWSRPDVPGRRVPVRVLVDDKVLGTYLLDHNGWQQGAWFLPAVLGEETWGDVEDGLAELGIGETHRQAAAAPTTSAGWLQGWEELRRWRPRPGPPSAEFRIVVEDTFVPAELLEDNNDHRRLGVGVGRFAWSFELPAEGIGFHAWETLPGGARFRWTEGRASLPLLVDGAELSFALRADHPDIADLPLEVEVYWQATLLRSIQVDDTDWQEVSVSIPAVPGESGVVTISVDRTWIPAEVGTSDDSRALGVAVTEVVWRQR